MARWHLVNPLGQSERTTDADDLFWAKRRFAPIPKDWYVVSDASYHTPSYKVKPELVELCSKCLRYPAVQGMKQCGTCAERKREAYHKQGTSGRSKVERYRATREAWKRDHPEEYEAYRRKQSERMAEVRQRTRVSHKVRQANIARGIERRRAKREAQLSLGL